MSGGAIRRILDEGQRELLARMQFRAEVTQNPVRALLASGIVVNESQADWLREVANRPYTDEDARRRAVLAEVKEEVGSAKVDSLLSTVGSWRNVIVYFGGEHQTFLEGPPPKPGAKCSHCGTVFEDGESGFRIGDDEIRENCFLSVVRPRGGKVEVPQNPRRRR